MSGQTRFPETHVSSAVFTITVISSSGMTLFSPARSFGVPVPPDSMIILIIRLAGSGDMVFGGWAVSTVMA